MDDKRQKKVLLMRTSIAVFMILLFSLWVFNLKNVWIAEQNLTAANPNDTRVSWTSLKADLSQVLTDTKNQLKELEKAKEIKEKNNQTALLSNLLGGVDELAAAATSTATTTSPLATTTPAINSTSTKGIKDNNKKCPEYINCMPTIGAARSCQVPAGCENITIIAY